MSNEQNENAEGSRKKKLIALKDFKFKHGKKVYEIKEGKEVNVPKIFLANLKTEKVIK